jgi:predicted TIM-barrel fold metal-dependent hydrolase
MIDAFVHLDMSAADPAADLRARMRDTGADRALVVETGAGDNRAVLDGILELRDPSLPVVYMYRGQPLQPLLKHEGFAGIRATSKLLEGNPAWLGQLAASGRWLVPHAESGIGLLARQLRDIAGARPELKVCVPHLGWPRRGGRDDPDWPEAVKILAALDRVIFGVSAMTAFTREWFPHPGLRRLIEPALRRFGPARLVAATDYPYVDKVNYPRYLALARQWILDAWPNWSDDDALRIG